MFKRYLERKRITKKPTEGEKRIMKTLFSLAHCAGVTPERLADVYSLQYQHGKGEFDVNDYRNRFVNRLKVNKEKF
jgi:hypothetical protein